MQKNISLQENQEQLIVMRKENDQLSIRLDQTTQENHALRKELQEKEKTLSSIHITKNYCQQIKYWSKKMQ